MEGEGIGLGRVKLEAARYVVDVFEVDFNGAYTHPSAIYPAAEYRDLPRPPFWLKWRLPAERRDQSRYPGFRPPQGICTTC